VAIRNRSSSPHRCIHRYAGWRGIAVGTFLTGSFDILREVPAASPRRRERRWSALGRIYSRALRVLTLRVRLTGRNERKDELRTAGILPRHDIPSRHLPRHQRCANSRLPRDYSPDQVAEVPTPRRDFRRRISSAYPSAFIWSMRISSAMFIFINFCLLSLSIPKNLFCHRRMYELKCMKCFIFRASSCLARSKSFTGLRQHVGVNRTLIWSHPQCAASGRKDDRLGRVIKQREESTLIAPWGVTRVRALDASLSTKSNVGVPEVGGLVFAGSRVIKRRAVKRWSTRGRSRDGRTCRCVLDYGIIASVPCDLDRFTLLTPRICLLSPLIELSLIRRRISSRLQRP